MNYNSFTKPTLTEPGVKYFLSQTLKQCHDFKTKYHNYIFNMALLGFFLFILGSILIYKYRGKLTPAEKDRKNNDKKTYILSKIKNFQDAKRQAQQELISGLPEWGSTEYSHMVKRH